MARSTDGGRSFTEHRVDQPDLCALDDIFYGAYLGLAAHGGRVVAVYPRPDGPGRLAVFAAICAFD